MAMAGGPAGMEMLGLVEVEESPWMLPQTREV
jgi:hypothetical protein